MVTHLEKATLNGKFTSVQIVVLYPDMPHFVSMWLVRGFRSLTEVLVLLQFFIQDDAAFSSPTMMSPLDVAVEKDTAKRYIGVCQLSLAQANKTVQRMKAKEGGRLFPLSSHLAA
ncbi:hypothetical protein EAF00_004675 [Botryotinia globosa]|nr:hypothetical protein EAF00_004675 [Botryotinia globosa]